MVDIYFYYQNLQNQTENQYTQLTAFHRHTVWDFEIAGSSNFIKHQSKSTEFFLLYALIARLCHCLLGVSKGPKFSITEAFLIGA